MEWLSCYFVTFLALFVCIQFTELLAEHETVSRGRSGGLGSDTLLCVWTASEERVLEMQEGSLLREGASSGALEKRGPQEGWTLDTHCRTCSPLFGGGMHLKNWLTSTVHVDFPASVSFGGMLVPPICLSF